MKFVLYSSDSKLGNIDINSLLKAAIEKNSRLGITGFLMSHSSGFIQYIEGGDKEIDDLYAVISQDPRHTNVTTLLESDISQRLYQEWDMGHVYIDDDEMVSMLMKTDKLKWFEYLKERTLFLYPNEFKTEHTASSAG
ncbi:BLUF domain-containing protein [Vibrio sp. LaRot3]|uniref:BLUF domain-containing protein n=1 Tax=Vibrio sp. LaRot3 TaxID=2998829 RepID=UPI0022CE05C0|nr:BLUF domain-containing protein [Vibrio sp. LaRot3]MDA0147204.1 BLUF domain-containing protein [Vibrio sp. LaRot3]